MIAIYKNDLINVLRRFKGELENGYFVPAEEGKGLSSNDYTDADKQKLTSLPAADEIVVKVTGKDLSTNDYTDADKAKVTTIPASFDPNNYVEKETGKGLSSNDFTNTYKNTIDSLPASNTIAVLDANSKIPVANLPAEFTALETVATYSDLPATNLFDGRRVMVLDASGDSTVTSGFAVYVYSTTNQAWRKILEGESMDVSAIVDWSNIQNKPSDLLHETDIVDGLTSTSTTDALSANQGKELKGLIDGLGTAAYSASTDFAASNHNHDSSYISAVAEGTANGTIKVTKNGSDSDISVHGLQSGAYQKIEVVSSLPASPDSDTLYFVLAS